MPIAYVSIETQIHGLKMLDASYLEFLEGWIAEAVWDALRQEPEIGYGQPPRGALAGDVTVEVVETAGKAGQTLISRRGMGAMAYRKARGLE